jgi:hypothetical protein
MILVAIESAGDEAFDGVYEKGNRRMRWEEKDKEEDNRFVGAFETACTA